MSGNARERRRQVRREQDTPTPSFPQGTIPDPSQIAELRAWTAFLQRFPMPVRVIATVGLLCVFILWLIGFDRLSTAKGRLDDLMDLPVRVTKLSTSIDHVSDTVNDGDHGLRALGRKFDKLEQRAEQNQRQLDRIVGFLQGTFPKTFGLLIFRDAARAFQSGNIAEGTDLLDQANEIIQLATSKRIPSPPEFFRTAFESLDGVAQSNIPSVSQAVFKTTKALAQYSSALQEVTNSPITEERRATPNQLDFGQVFFGPPERARLVATPMLFGNEFFKYTGPEPARALTATIRNFVLTPEAMGFFSNWMDLLGKTLLSSNA